ncbi:MAG: hypothetical protein Q4E09_04745 [Eubacteriales bacterium]|nr:hypothetical protein [Eubacteriales bacterium]
MFKTKCLGTLHPSSASSGKLVSKACRYLQERHSRLSLGLALLFQIVAILAFPGAGNWALWLAVPQLVLISKVFFLYIRSRQEVREERDFAAFISYLASAVSSGRNLELSLVEARDKFCPELDENSRINQAVADLSLSLYAGLGLRESLLAFSNPFRQSSIRIFAQVLASLVEWGVRYDIYLQLQRDNLHKELEVKAEIRSIQSATIMETLIMSLMPFAMSFAISRSAFTRDLYEEAIWQPLQTLLLLLSVLGFALALRLLTHGFKQEKLKPVRLASEIREQSFGYKLATAWAGILTRIYRQDQQKQICRHLAYLYPKEDQLWERWCLTKLYWLGLPLLPALLFAEAAFLLVMPLIFFLPDASLHEKEKQLKQRELEEYPLLLNLLAILIASGLTAERSLRLTLQVLLREDQSKPGSTLTRYSNLQNSSLQKRSKKTQKRMRKKDFPYQDLLELDLTTVRKGLESGLTADQALADLASRRFHAETAQLLHLLSRYAQEGAEEQVNMIRIQAMRSTDNLRNAMRERLSRKGLKLLLPMALDLILVLAIAALPALLQMYV